MTDAGGTARLVSTEPGEVQAFNHLDKGDTFAVDARKPDDLDAFCAALTAELSTH